MRCVTGPAVFRLLDPYVGWDATEVTGVTGLGDPAGLRLDRSGGAAARQELLPWFPDPRLALPPCRPYYLLTGHGVRRLDPGSTAWRPMASPPVREPVAVAAAGHWLAVADRHGVRVWWRAGEHLVTHLSSPGAAILALTPGGGVYLAAREGTDLRYARPGAPTATVIRTGLPGTVEGLRTGPGHTLWLLLRTGGTLDTWRSADHGATWERADPTTLPASPLTATGDDGFSLDGIGAFTWDGAPTGSPVRAAPALLTEGGLDTAPIDSGISRCRWHRVGADATVPAGTAVTIAVAVTEDAATVPDPADWQQAPPGSRDFLVQQPPGRYLHLRLGLTGDGTATPEVRRIRLDFPRSTSAELLPPAYLSDRADPAAEDFTQRFLALFDTVIGGLDRVIERYPALLDPSGVPDRALPWLGGLLGLAFEAGWSTAVRRALLAAAPELYRRRGTPWAVREAVRIVHGVEPGLVEQGTTRSWVRLGADGALGGARLFGRSTARFRVGTSALSTAPLRSAGDPRQDPLTVDAYRFRVVLPAGAAGVDVAALERLVTAHAPAHTRGRVVPPGPGWVVGLHSAAGVDTVFTAPPPIVLGAATARLGGANVVAPSRAGRRIGVVVGEPAGEKSVAW
ncbi:phage tail protein [Actinoplanes sp. NPDC051851]|uniref:phage tail protein n=1 Tax=Actinoplanes sp. NPDC051851 TaxID=3154753 RepID=UPI003421BFD7